MNPTVLVFPAYADNPFLTMLLASTRRAGWQVESVVPLPEFITAAARLRAGDAVHLNWTAQVTQSARTPWGAERNARRFLAALDEARARGVRVVWTVHNAIAHDARNARQDARLQEALAARADAIHIMNAATAELVEFALPSAKVRHLPHPSYLGVYGAPPSAAQARAELGVDGAELTVLLLGHMKPYKGVLDLVAAAKATSRPVTLLLAGRGDWRAIDDAAAGARVIAHRDYVAEADVPTWFAAADVTVLPYRRILNSGSAMLAATFGVPAVLPDEPSVLAEFGDQGWVMAYDRSEPVQGIRALLEDASIDWAAKGAQARAFAQTLRPETISDAFLDLLREVTGR